MRLIFRIIGATLAIVKLSGAYYGEINDSYTTDKQLESVQNISNNKLLDFKTIANTIPDDYERARFYYIISYEIDRIYAYRPDLLAYDLYGTPRLWWVFAQRNPNEIEDPIYDFKPGTVIRIPKLSNLQNDLGL